MRVNQTSVPQALAPEGTAGASSPTSKSAPAARVLDEVELSRAAAVIPEDRSGKIAAVTAAISDRSYLPPSLPVIRALVQGAISQTERARAEALSAGGESQDKTRAT